MADIYSEVGANIRSQRLEQGLTLEDLAELAGLHASYIGQIERGVKKCSLRTLEQVSKALGVSPDRLLAARSRARKKADAAGKLEAVVRASSESEKRLLISIAKQLAKGLRELRS